MPYAELKSVFTAFRKLNKLIGYSLYFLDIICIEYNVAEHFPQVFDLS